MVSTRHHPRPFPEPILPPSRSPNHAAETASPTREAPSSPTESAPSVVKRRSVSRRRKTVNDTDDTAIDTHTTSVVRRAKSKSRSSGYVHTPTSLLLTWLVVELILVAWDTLYVMFRPHTMPGGKFHSPIWTPYALYGTIDYIYGWPAWNAKNGFTAAQAYMNALESLFFGFYLFIVARGVNGGLKAGILEKIWRPGKHVEVSGRLVPEAVLFCFAATIMTLSKTILYWLNEYFSGFANVGHNSWPDLVLLWIIPNGAWLVFPSYMVKVLGLELLKGMRGSLVKQR